MAANRSLWIWLGRVVLAFSLFALLGLGIPRPAQAAVSPGVPKASLSEFISVVAVQKNTEVTVSAQGFPAHTSFKVRVGPYYKFFTQAVNMGWLDTGDGGDFQFNIMLPDVVKDVDLVTVRLDSADYQVSYNAFQNVDTGTIDTSSGVVTLTPAEAETTTATAVEVTSTPEAAATTAPAVVATKAPAVYVAPTKTPEPSWSAYGCQVLSTEPTVSVPTNWDFDAIWVVENTGYWTWDMHAVRISYYSGDHLEKFGDIAIPASTKQGDQVTLRGDMLAPGKAGTYHTVWQVHADRGPICLLPFTLVVK